MRHEINNLGSLNSVGIASFYFFSSKILSVFCVLFFFFLRVVGLVVVKEVQNTSHPLPPHPFLNPPSLSPAYHVPVSGCGIRHGLGPRPPSDRVQCVSITIQNPLPTWLAHHPLLQGDLVLSRGQGAPCSLEDPWLR